MKQQHITVQTTSIHASAAGEASRLDLPLDLIDIDPNQPRHILPHEIREMLVAGRITPVEAIQLWYKLVEDLAKQSGKSLDETPEGRRLLRLKALALSIKAGGQVNPITVVHHGDRWRIETGERRYWAHVWLLVMEQDELGLTIPAIVQPHTDVSRQAAENLHSEPLNDIALARLIAWQVHWLDNPAARQDFTTPLTWADYCQIASSRIPYGGWSQIAAVMGKTPDHLKRCLQLLLLPEQAGLLADRHDLTEYQLRPVITLRNPHIQTRIVELIIELGLHGRDVKWLCKQPDLDIAEQILRKRREPDDEESEESETEQGPEHTIYDHMQKLLDQVHAVEEDGRNPAYILATSYLNKGGDPEEELVKLIRVLKEALKQMRIKPIPSKELDR